MVLDALVDPGAMARLAWYALAYAPVGWPVLVESWRAFSRGDFFNEFSLMSVATFGAFLIGEYPEGVAVMLFYSVGELCQAGAVRRARRGINALLEARPDSASVVRDGETRRVPPSEVEVGETVEVVAGERVPLDGALQSGAAMFNAAALTGESLPRLVESGEEVLAGMIATEGVARITVSRPFERSAFARVLRMVEEAAERKAPAERFIHKFARVYTPVVVGLAALIVVLPWVVSLLSPGFVYSFAGWFHRGLVFLVISCPCALVISIPLGYFGGIGAASREGILFKGGNYLDAITRVDTVVLDKTGTLTRGVFEVTGVEPAAGISPDELLRVLASVEALSTHPIARAVTREAGRRGIALESPTSPREVAGRGMEALLGGRRVLAGNARLLEGEGIAFPPSKRLETEVLCAVDGAYAGRVSVADVPKEDAAGAIADLKRVGVRRVVMLSGDRADIVAKLAGQLGIEEAHGDLLPEGKVAHLERLKASAAGRVAFVGDGINDAPVLALSDVGMAMGGLGSDVAIETADVVIQTDQPGKIATAIRIGRRTRRIVIQNVVFAFGVKFIVLGLGAAGVANLWEAVFADVGVALLAILNASRMLAGGKKYTRDSSLERGIAGQIARFDSPCRT
ncbi:MAG: cadmium-translocating P-type ATPase [Odoribacteraceae bacterium]|nr:cadmium-translocating P-type ATPase [Odoribacteraceae bacterium]